MTRLSDDHAVVQRILDHIDNQTTDLSDGTWREPVQHYLSEERFAAELESVLRRYPTPFCPSAALPTAGSYLARDAAHTPILAVRGSDGRVRAFRNACRHREHQQGTNQPDTTSPDSLVHGRAPVKTGLEAGGWRLGARSSRSSAFIRGAFLCLIG